MKPLLVFVLLVLGAGAAHAADVPIPAFCIKPAGLTLVGHAGATPDPLSSATFVIRKVLGIPISGAEVLIDFSACTDVRLSADALEPGFLLDCDHKVIRGFADQAGQITFHIVGSGNGVSPRGQASCAVVIANGVILGSLAVSTYDQDGVNGVNAFDLSIAYSDTVSGEYRARSDFDFDGDVDGLDIGRLYRAVLAGGSVSSGAANCGP